MEPYLGWVKIYGPIMIGKNQPFMLTQFSVTVFAKYKSKIVLYNYFSKATKIHNAIADVHINIVKIVV